MLGHVLVRVSLSLPTAPTHMSLADALNPQISENAPVDEAHLPHDVNQPASIDQDEEMDDLFDEDAIVDQAERYSSIFTPCPTLRPIHRRYVGTIS